MTKKLLIHFNLFQTCFTSNSGFIFSSKNLVDPVGAWAICDQSIFFAEFLHFLIIISTRYSHVKCYLQSIWLLLKFVIFSIKPVKTFSSRCGPLIKDLSKRPLPYSRQNCCWFEKFGKKNNNFCLGKFYLIFLFFELIFFLPFLRQPT